MTTTIKQTEAAPASYPPAPAGLSTAAAALNAGMIWQRIEAYVVHRWTARTVEWLVEGCGSWHPPLFPATISTFERWEADAWQAITVTPTPLGYRLPGGTYRFIGTAGAGATVPADVNEAFKRLAEFMAATQKGAGLTRERVTAGSVTVDKSHSASWAASTMANSGAGDLLRPYRGVKC